MHLRERAVAEAGAARREVVAGGNGEVAEGGQDLSGRVALDLAAVLGDMLELGAAGDVEHETIGRYIQQRPVDIVLTFGDLIYSL